MTSSHFWNSSCQRERQPPWGLNQITIPVFMFFVLLDDKEMLDEGRQQPKNVVLIRHQNHLICSVVYVFNHKYGFEQDFFCFFLVMTSLTYWYLTYLVTSSRVTYPVLQSKVFCPQADNWTGTVSTWKDRKPSWLPEVVRLGHLPVLEVNRSHSNKQVFNESWKNRK